jgi:hypothetical protein
LAVDRAKDLEAENQRHMLQIGDLKALRTMLNGEIERLRRRQKNTTRGPTPTSTSRRFAATCWASRRT